jgi:hypothetical protein
MGAHPDERQNGDESDNKGREQMSLEGNEPHQEITPGRKKTEGDQRSHLTKKKVEMRVKVKVKVPRKDGEGKRV